MATARRERAEAGGDRCAEEKDDAEETMAKRARRAAADLTGEPGASSYPPRGRLAAVHPHARDARITFEATTHTYTLDGSPLPASVTAVGSGCFESFDARAVLRRSLLGWAQNPQHKYYALIRFFTLIVGLTRAECELSILKLWNAIGEEQSQLGTDLHAQIELSLDEAAWEGPRPRDIPATGPATPASKEWLQYQAFHTMINTDRNWSIYRTEWSIYDDDSLVGGQIDAVYVDGKGAMHIVDWKRSKKDLTHSARHWNR